MEAAAEAGGTMNNETLSPRTEAAAAAAAAAAAGLLRLPTSANTTNNNLHNMNPPNHVGVRVVTKRQKTHAGVIGAGKAAVLDVTTSGRAHGSTTGTSNSHVSTAADLDSASAVYALSRQSVLSALGLRDSSSGGRNGGLQDQHRLAQAYPSHPLPAFANSQNNAAVVRSSLGYAPTNGSYFYAQGHHHQYPPSAGYGPSPSPSQLASREIELAVMEEQANRELMDACHKFAAIEREKKCFRQLLEEQRQQPYAHLGLPEASQIPVAAHVAAIAAAAANATTHYGSHGISFGASQHSTELLAAEHPVCPVASATANTRASTATHLESANATIPSSATEGSGLPTRGNLPNMERDVLTLAHPDDMDFLSKYMCFVRKECLEIVYDKITNSRQHKPIKDQRRVPLQAGIRCRFCAHLNFSFRVKRSAAFPSKIERLYQSVTMMLRDHFTLCKEIPEDVRVRLDVYKSKYNQSSKKAALHWIKSANEVGLYDDPGNFIRLGTPTKDKIIIRSAASGGNLITFDAIPKKTKNEQTESADI